MKKPAPAILGHTVDGAEPVQIDIDELIGSDICVIANKGAGKSGMLRVLFEQTRPLIQQIILDPEDEFYTLREAGEYLVAGGETGDCPAEIANAGALARMLMENPGISAVIQLGHLKPWDQETFVALFLEELMSAPRALWHPFMLGVDETHRFAPQGEQVASSKAMHDVSARGRKRGITPVFATQRMAAIDKNVTAGVSTWFLGRVGQDIDRRTAANALGMAPGSAEAKEIPFLPKRTFWTFGAATSLRPILFKVADAQTTMVKAGQALVATPPPPKSLQKLLQALAKAAAPAPAEEPAATAQRLPQADLDAIRKEAARDAYQQGVDLGFTNGHASGSWSVLRSLEKWLADQMAELQEGREIDPGVDDRDITIPALDHAHPEIIAHLEKVKPVVEERRRRGGEVIEMSPFRKPDAGAKVTMVKAVTANPAAQANNVAGAALLAALTKHHPMRLRWAQIAGFSGRKAKGGSFNTAKRWLLDNGLIEEKGDIVMATPAGLERSPPPEQGLDKVAAWVNILPTPANQLLEYLVDHPGQTIQELADATGRQPKGGSWNTAMSHLKSNDLIEEVDGRLSASRWLFD